MKHTRVQPNPELIDELYHRQQKTFPGELPFPERINLPLTELAFNTGKRRRIVKKKQQYVKGFGKDRKEWEKDVWIIEYDRPSRLDIAIHNCLPKIIKAEQELCVHSHLYDHIQFSTAITNDQIDLEYLFHIYPIDKRTKARIESFDEFDKKLKIFDNPLKIRFQYAARYTNSAGSYWEIYGYIYIPERKK